jgi:hypothetical protein
LMMICPLRESGCVLVHWLRREEYIEALYMPEQHGERL